MDAGLRGLGVSQPLLRARKRDVDAVRDGQESDAVAPVRAHLKSPRQLWRSMDALMHHTSWQRVNLCLPLSASNDITLYSGTDVAGTRNLARPCFEKMKKSTHTPSNLRGTELFFAYRVRNVKKSFFVPGTRI